MKEYSNVSWLFLADEESATEPATEAMRWDLFGQYDDEKVAA